MQRMIAVEDRHLWVISLFGGTLGVAVAGLIAIVFGAGYQTFGVLAAIGFVTPVLCTVRQVLSVSRTGLPSLFSDLDRNCVELRSQLSEARLHHIQLSDYCGRLRAAIAALDDLEDAQERLEKLRRNAHCQAVFERVSSQVTRLRRILGEERYDLLSIDWQSLDGIPFEHFLARVFRSLGFHVQLTKTTGDQGADLIASKGTLRIAIQSKSYTNSVGNDAVQQAFAGMAFYRCNQCAVITNSRFTSSAEALAKRVGCRLIAGTDIPALINGQLL
jgi:restriction endonuclease Mrr